MPPVARVRRRLPDPARSLVESSFLDMLHRYDPFLMTSMASGLALEDLPAVPRLWRPRDQPGRAHSDPEFLDQLGVAESAGLVGIGTARARGCTILLGAPGAGKTTELLRFLDARRLDRGPRLVTLPGVRG
jgi:hypothetical protein